LGEDPELESSMTGKSGGKEVFLRGEGKKGN